MTVFNIESLEIPDIKLITHSIYKDDRGYFVEKFNSLLEIGLNFKPVQTNMSFSKPNVIRGLHYQGINSQAKLVTVVKGRILDVVVDLRNLSPTFGQYVMQELDTKKGHSLYVPEGFAHGFCVLGKHSAKVLYQVNNYRHEQSESGILYNDTTLNIPWPIKNPILSRKDLALPTLTHYKKGSIVF